MGNRNVGQVQKANLEEVTSSEETQVPTPHTAINYDVPSPQQPEPSHLGSRFTKDVVETVKGFGAAVAVQGIYHQFGPSLTTGYVWLDMTLLGTLPVVFKHSAEIVHDLTTNEGDFGHGLLSKEALNRYGWNLLETVGGAAGGFAAQYGGTAYLTGCLKPIAYIGYGVVGGFAGKATAKMIKLAKNLGQSDSVAEKQEQEVAPEPNPNPNAGYKAPNTIQNIFNVFDHGIFGYTMANLANCGAKCLSYGIPNPLIQVGMQAGVAVVSKLTQHATSDRSFREQLGLPPAGGVELPKIEPTSSMANEDANNSQSLQDYSKLQSSVFESKSNNAKDVESQHPQATQQYASHLKAAAKAIASTGVTLVSYGVGYVVTNYVCQFDEANDDKVVCRNAMVGGIAIGTEALLRTTYQHSDKLVSGAKAVGNGIATVGQGLGNGLSRLSSIGMSMFGGANKPNDPERESLTQGIEQRTPGGPGNI